MTRSTARTVGTGRVIDSPVGKLLLAADDQALTHLLFADGEVDEPSGNAAVILAETERQLREYFDGRRREFDLRLAPAGTDFQRSVWTALCEIPWGETISYGELARRVVRPRAARAVGAANGANPISIIIPCHRVIGADRQLIGYGGGLDAKRLLLGLEAAPVLL